MKIEKDGNLVVILSTAPDREVAVRVARALVEQRLAACVNLVAGIESIYRWQGKLESSPEWMLVIKTTVLKQQAALEALSKIHPYEVPEGLVLPVSGGLESYLAWIGDSVREDCDSLG